jgi:hypothetical protein
MCNVQGDPHDSLDEEWMEYLNQPTLLPMENVDGQMPHVDVKVDMVGLINDAFVIVNENVHSTHNIES